MPCADDYPDRGYGPNAGGAGKTTNHPAAIAHDHTRAKKANSGDHAGNDAGHVVGEGEHAQPRQRRRPKSHQG